MENSTIDNDHDKDVGGPEMFVGRESNGTTHRELRSSIISGHKEDKREHNDSIPFRAKHIVKIFHADDPDTFIEVTSEQLHRVKCMHEKMDEGTTLSFNYNCLLFCASILAGLGLVSNSVATIIASMLVSPLMGPVIGLAYGSTIRDWTLVRKAALVEIISLIFCIVMGILLACVTGPTGLSDSWPTAEMAGRGTLQNFLVALPVAFFSGLGVAVSVLDDQTASLVGVAISASLLPPAVNAGILWVAYFFSETNVIDSVCDNLSSLRNATTGTIYDVDCDEILRIFGQEKYEVKTYYQMGIISLSVTIANIALIWVSSMLMFRMKEVLPIKKNVFWNDLGIARKIYQRRALVRIENIQLSSEAETSNLQVSNLSAPIFSSEIPEKKSASPAN